MYLLYPPETRSKQASIKEPRESLKLFWRGKQRLKGQKQKNKIHVPPRSNGRYVGKNSGASSTPAESSPPMTHSTGSSKALVSGCHPNQPARVQQESSMYHTPGKAPTANNTAMYSLGYPVLPPSRACHPKSPPYTSFSFTPVPSPSPPNPISKTHYICPQPMLLSHLHSTTLVQATIISHPDHCNSFAPARPASASFLCILHLKWQCSFHSTVCSGLLVAGGQQPDKACKEALHSLVPTSLSALLSHQPPPQSACWPHWSSFSLSYLPSPFLSEVQVPSAWNASPFPPCPVNFKYPLDLRTRVISSGEPSLFPRSYSPVYLSLLALVITAISHLFM